MFVQITHTQNEIVDDGAISRTALNAHGISR